MIEFWLPSLVLLVFALAFIFVPVYRYVKNETMPSKGSSKRESSEVLAEDRQRQNVLIFKERLAELEGEYAQGKHQESTFLQLKSELEVSLLDDVERATNAVGIKPKNRQGLNAGNLAIIVLSAVLVVAVSYGTYFKFGAYDDVAKTNAMRFDENEIAQAQASAEQGDMNALLDQLYHKLIKAPDNIEGWRMLARSAMTTERYELAVAAYTQIIRIFDATDERTAAVYGLLAQAHYYQNQGRLNSAAQSALDKAFKQNPDEVNSLGLIAINAFVGQDYAVAIENWQKILVAVPDHPSRVSIETGIKRAQMALGETPAAMPIMTSPKNTADSLKAESTIARIQVEVSIAPAVLAKVNADDTVFIFAKAVAGTGPAMPLAARKLRVSDLPITIELNDQSAMGPMAKLSQVKLVNVVARVSKSGQPIAQSGDYEGQHENVEVYANKSIRINISQEKK